MKEDYQNLLDAVKNDDSEAFNDALKPLMAKRVETVLKMRKVDVTKDILDR